MTKLRNTTKLKKLLEQDIRIFRTTDLAVLWEIVNKETLWKTIYRYVKRQILYPIQKGLYSTVPIEKLDDYELGCAMCGPFSYISTETVLQNKGIIMQGMNKTTLIGQKRREFKFKDKIFLCRYLNTKYLLNRKGILQKTRYYIATKERAFSDLMHINPNYFVDNNQSIDSNKVNKLKTQLGYK
ncbi:hypothetical protein JW796_01510 [Candidatus Dojkabacteria bacterium]|nr:hypothetical protein [Candidatus Dojkabacteria bacterium]